MSYQPAYQQNNHIKKDIEQESQELNNKMSNLFAPKQEDTDILKEFTMSKSDPKYQTLPYNTKFTVNLVPTRTSNRITETNNNVNNSNEIKEGTSSWTHANGHMTVHSAPLSAINKNIATPLNQNDLLSRKIDHPKDQSGIPIDTKSANQTNLKLNIIENSSYPTHSAIGASTNYQVCIS